MPMFGFPLHMLSLIGSTGALLDIDFTTLPFGGSTLPAGPANLATPCASAARTVQTGTDADQSKYPVSSGIAANLALIGREQDWWAPGLVVEGPVVNLLTNPRTLSSLSAVVYVANQGVGTDSPDGAYSSPVLSGGNSAGGYFRSTRTNPSFSFWRRQYAGSNVPSRNSLYTVAGTAYALDSGVTPTTWGRRTLSLICQSTAVDCMFLDGYPARYGSSPAYSTRLDMALVEEGMVPHEFYDGTKAGGGLTCDASRVVVGGRLSVYWKGRPKGSINGSNPWTYNPWIIGKDANNCVLFDAITGLVSCTVAGATFIATIPINFYRASLVEIWIEAGGGSLATVIKAKVDGVITTLGTSVSPQAAFPATGTLGICCNPADLTTSQFESWVNRVTFFSPGSRPTQFQSDPYALMYDFTGLALGAPATPSGLTYTCATAARTVQTSDATVTSGIAANAIRVGRESSRWLPGLVLEGAVTNSVTSPRAYAGTGWTVGGETFTAQGAGSNSPDGTVTSPRVQQASGVAPRYFLITANAPGAAFIWRNTAGALRSLISHAGGSGGTLSSGTETGNGSGAWSKRAAVLSTASTGGQWNVIPAEARALNGYVTGISTDGYFDFAQIEVGSKVPHEFHDGAKAAEILSVPVAFAVVNGRLGVYCRFRPKFSSSTGVNPAPSAVTLWQIDASNIANWYIASDNKIHMAIGGVDYPSSALPTIARGDDVEIWLEVGGGIPITCWVRVNNVLTAVSFGGAVAPNLASTGTLALGNNGGTTVLEAWHATFRTYKPGLRPDFQDPNILWRADFTRLQAGTDVTPLGMSVTCATSARTVQVGDNLVVSAITNDVLLIGRESSAWALGAVLEGAVTNLVVSNPRSFVTGAGWNVGAPDGYVGPTGGVVSPDNTVNSPEVACSQGAYGRYYNNATATTGAFIASVWLRAVTTSKLRVRLQHGSTSYTLGANDADATASWAKYSQIVPADASQSVIINLSEGRAIGYTGTSASDCFYDFVQIQAGSIPHEFVLTSKVGTVHSVPAATVVSAGRLSLHMVMRPKGSIAGANPWTWHPTLWQNDANNYCQLDEITGILTSTIAGASQVASTGLTFARGDRLEWWYAGGGGTLSTVIKLRKNGGAIVTITLPAQGTVPNTGNIGLGCNPSAPDTGSLEGWYELVEAYAAGTSPAWAA